MSDSGVPPREDLGRTMRQAGRQDPQRRRWPARRRVAAWLPVLVVPFLVAACSSSGSTTSTGTAGSTKPFVYLMSSDFTGPTKQFTIAAEVGVEAAVKDINASGGILGRKVVLETQNDQSDPTTAVTLLEQRLSSGDKPDAMFPGGSSAITVALEPVLTQNKILSTNDSISNLLNNAAKYPYFFGVGQLASEPVPSFVSALKAKGYQKIGMIFADDASGQSSEAAFSAGIKAAGMQFSAVSYSPTALDMTPQLQQLKADNVDAVVYNSLGTPTLYIINGRNQMEWSSEPFYGDADAASYAYSQNLTPAALKNVFIQTYSAFLANGVASNWPALQHVIATVKTVPGGPAALTTTGSWLITIGYSALEMVKLGVDQAGSTNADAVQAALENLKLPSPSPLVSLAGPTGNYGGFHYTSTNHYPTLTPTAFTNVSPGSYNADGLYVPGSS